MDESASFYNSPPLSCCFCSTPLSSFSAPILFPCFHYIACQACFSRTAADGFPVLCFTCNELVEERMDEEVKGIARDMEVWKHQGYEDSSIQQEIRKRINSYRNGDTAQNPPTETKEIQRGDVRELPFIRITEPFQSPNWFCEACQLTVPINSYRCTGCSRVNFQLYSFSNPTLPPALNFMLETAALPASLPIEERKEEEVVQQANVYEPPQWTTPALAPVFNPTPQMQPAPPQASSEWGQPSYPSTYENQGYGSNPSYGQDSGIPTSQGAVFSPPALYPQSATGPAISHPSAYAYYQPSAAINPPQYAGTSSHMPIIPPLALNTEAKPQGIGLDIDIYSCVREKLVPDEGQISVPPGMSTPPDSIPNKGQSASYNPGAGHPSTGYFRGENKVQPSIPPPARDEPAAVRGEVAQQPASIEVDKVEKKHSACCSVF